MALALCAGVLAACSPTAAEEPSSLAALESTALAAPGPNVAPPEANARREATAPLGTPAEAAEVFASALVTGDLTAVTLSFAPSGLAEARALVDRNGATGISHFDAASVHAVEEVDSDEAQWDIVFALSSSRGDSKLWTRWQWFEGVGWRIAALGTRA